MVKLTLNGTEHQVESGITLLEAARRAGHLLPTFCNHQLLKPVASCRVCLVEIEGIPRLQPACATRVADGMVVQTHSDKASAAQKSMIKLLLANHPLDCPICDKGGECELQDKTLLHGPRISFFEEDKRVFHDSDPVLNKVIVANSNRCIQCQRCVRICDEVVGANAIGIIGRGAHCIETGFQDNLNDCDHCGNCIEVCPVGALMRLPYRYKARPWDLQSTDTLCPHCGTGCTISAETRDNELVRVRAKETNVLNRELLCARGRFGIDFVDHTPRITAPMIRQQGELRETSWDQALARAAELLRRPTMALLSARLSNEVVQAGHHLFHQVVDNPHIYVDLTREALTRRQSTDAWQQAEAGQTALLGGELANKPLEHLLTADVVAILGCNIDHQNPVSDYLVRRALNDTDTRLFIASTRACRLDSRSEAWLRLTPDLDQALLSVLALGDDAPQVQGAEPFVAAWQAAVAQAATVSLLVGSDWLTDPRKAAAVNTLQAHLRQQGKSVALQGLWRHCNQLGVRDVANAWPAPPIPPAEALQQAESLYLVDQALPGDLGENRAIVYQGAFMDDTARRADVLLPGVSFAETTGSWTNNEGRVQRLTPFTRRRGQARTDTDILALLCRELGGAPQATLPPQAFAALCRQVPAYQALSWQHLTSGQCFRQNTADPSKLLVRADIRHKPTSPPSSAYGDDAFCLIAETSLFHARESDWQSPLLDDIEDGAWVEISPADARRLALQEGQLLHLRHGDKHCVLAARITERAADNVLIASGDLRGSGIDALLHAGDAGCPVSASIVTGGAR